MNKRNIIIYIIISITLIIILSIFIIFKNKKIYITKVDELDNIKISMLKLEDGNITIIKQVPTTGDWIMTYECDDATVKIYLDEGNRKLLMKNIKPTVCIIKFEKSLSDINEISMYVDDVYTGELDTNKTYDLISYDCANNETVTWYKFNRKVSITPLNKNTNCKLYFKEFIYLDDKILADNTPQSDAPINFDSTTGDGLYYTSDNTTYGEDNTRIYYFRGRVDNNWVSFGGFLWRIVRTTSEGGVKLVYSGNGSAISSGFVNTSTAFNSPADDRVYIGYTYNTGLESSSTIKEVIDTWYTNNLSSYASYLSDTAVYCNDRSSETIRYSDIDYPAYDRIVKNKRPTYACSSANASRYTISTETGNGYLQKPIALLTADEINYAGIRWDTGSSLNSYIMDNATSVDWWTMSPSYISPYYFDLYDAYEFAVISSGKLYSNYCNNTNGVRPAVSLKSCITVSGGNGSKSTPYVLSNSCT